MGCPAFRVDHGLIRGPIEMQVRLVDPAEDTQRGAKRRSCSLTGVAVDLTSAVAIIIPGPCVAAVANRGMGCMTPPVALPRIGIQLGAASRQVYADESMTRLPVRVGAYPPPRLARFTRDEAEDRGPIVGVGAVACALIGTAAGRGMRVARGRAFFPRVLIPLVCLTGAAHHHIGGCGGMQLALDALPEGMELCARQPQLARQAGRRLPLGHATPQEHQRGRPLASFFEDRPGQQRLVAFTGATAIGGKVALRSEEPSLRAPTMRTLQTVWVQVAFQPDGADTIVK